jgi:hypothetical protein
MNGFKARAVDTFDDAIHWLEEQGASSILCEKHSTEIA